MKTLYHSLVHPFISYGILAWGNARPSILRKTFLLQKRAIRIVNNAAYNNSHTEPLFKKSEVLSVTFLYYMRVYRRHRMNERSVNVTLVLALIHCYT